jgi:hypothetical protein
LGDKTYFQRHTPAAGLPDQVVRLFGGQLEDLLRLLTVTDSHKEKNVGDNDTNLGAEVGNFYD